MTDGPDMKDIGKALMKMVRLMNRTSQECTGCGGHVESLKQVGRCVYARPCGCRLWQGKISKEWKDTK